MAEVGVVGTEYVLLEDGVEVGVGNDLEDDEDCGVLFAEDVFADRGGVNIAT